ncbi:sulfoxide reductase heme-binding subunit YedZ [Advenella sp. WQ 585]|uniref:Protein-methionine-sulfoxide reductase heme-binding subunit MsrQ n=1 Tax=Advenella mandrilli TaxID=2800330 RepID=A0ABS1EAV1_9BURK|nr:protein-methionine-sulfoxide reductase heme-binding subunit MsrQ [Advenella mandrilli]MBK1780982.1 sulfoxide reductase heme-binding subunit YedZ [Advenella mandrilli]
MKTWKAESIDRIQPLIFILGLFPLVRWFYLDSIGGMTAEPAAFFARSSGQWALAMLCLTLAVTPIRQMLGQPALLRWRRTLGLYAFFYAFLHMIAWLWLDRKLSFPFMLKDLAERPYILLGMLSFAILCVLAATSRQKSIRKLGRNWQRLHRAVYVVGILLIIHFWKMLPEGQSLVAPVVFTLVMAFLLFWRVVNALMVRRKVQAIVDSVGNTSGPGRHS